jgi:hypothetical protein
MRPDIKLTKSTLMGTTLRLGDPDSRPEEAMEINIKTSKCTALNRPKSWKKFAERKKKRGPGGKVVEEDEDEDEMDVDEPEPTQGKKKVTFVQLKMRTEYYVDRREPKSDDEGEDVKMEEVEKEPEPEEDDEEGAPTNKIDPGLEQVDKEELIRGFKYGTTYVPCPDGQFGRLPTKKGIDICGFFLAKNVRQNIITSFFDSFNCSSAANCASVKSNMFGAIRRNLNKKSRSPPLRRRCTRRMPWPLRGGRQRVVPVFVRWRRGVWLGFCTLCRKQVLVIRIVLRRTVVGIHGFCFALLFGGGNGDFDRRLRLRSGLRALRRCLDIKEEHLVVVVARVDVTVLPSPSNLLGH